MSVSLKQSYPPRRVSLRGSTGETNTYKESPPYVKEGEEGASPYGGTPALPRGFVKWTILLFALVGMGGIGSVIHTMVSYSKPRDVSNSTELASKHRLAELEGFLKKTSNMLQAQLESVDTKYARELEVVKKELEEKIEEDASEFAIELNTIRKHGDDMEETLKQLKDAEILTRTDVQEIVNQIYKNQVATSEGQPLSLDDVRNVARQLVEEEIERHSADGLGMVDFALKSHGTKVVSHSRCHNCFTYLGINVGLHPDASKMLEPSFGQPGECLPLKGSKVFVDIALLKPILVNAVTLEHVAKSVTHDRSNAPKDFRIFGWLRQPNKKQSYEQEVKMFLLGEFTYDLDKKNIQTFTLTSESTGKIVNMIRLDVLSNQGSDSHTCIYRLRVHGSDNIHNAIKG